MLAQATATRGSSSWLRSWKEIYPTDSEREQDFAEAGQTYLEMIEAYRQCGYDSVRTAKGVTVREARFLLKQVHGYHVAWNPSS